MGERVHAHEYLSDKVPSVEGAERLNMTCGVQQGSVLGPTLCNIYYNWDSSHDGGNDMLSGRPSRD